MSSYARGLLYSKSLGGKWSAKKLPKNQWHTLLPNSHPAYISLEEYEQNQKYLRKMHKLMGKIAGKAHPERGRRSYKELSFVDAAKRMTLRYMTRSPGDLYPIYIYQRSAATLLTNCANKFQGRVLMRLWVNYSSNL